MYTSRNYETKKQLKAAVARLNELRKQLDHSLNESNEMARLERDLTVFSPGPFPAPSSGRVTIEGPHYPRPHKWYATCEVSGGIVVKAT